MSTHWSPVAQGHRVPSAYRTDHGFYFVYGWLTAGSPLWSRASLAVTRSFGWRFVRSDEKRFDAGLDLEIAWCATVVLAQGIEQAPERS